MKSRIEPGNADGHIYVESNETLNLKEMYDVMDAIISAYDHKTAKEEAIRGIINLWMDELQGISKGDVMPSLRTDQTLNSDDVL